MVSARTAVSRVMVGDQISTVEMIDESGRKSAMVGGAKAGGYWAAQPLPDCDGAGLTLMIGEGVATVLSARAATGHFGVAALSCSNLRAVARAMRERYPAISIVILADVGNGRKQAEAAAETAGGVVAVPDFSPEEVDNFRTEHGKEPSDFNDLAQIRGSEAVARVIASAVAPLSPSTGIEDIDLQAFLQACGDVFVAVRGSPPSRFEPETAKSLLHAYRQSHSPEIAGKFVAVSAATGAGKTLSAFAMMVHLYRRGLTGAVVMKEIGELDNAYRLLTKLIPAGEIAVWTSIHRENAHRSQLRKYEKQGVTASARFSVDDCKGARIILTTHERWQDEIANQTDYGINLCQGERRELIIVDEEPKLDRVYPFEPPRIFRRLRGLSQAAIGS